MGVAAVTTFLAVLILAVSSEPHNRRLRLKQHKNQRGLRQLHFSNVHGLREYDVQSNINYGRGNTYAKNSDAVDYRYGSLSQNSEAEISENSQSIYSGQRGQYKNNQFTGSELSAKQTSSQSQRINPQIENNVADYPGYPQSPRKNVYDSSHNHQHHNGKRTGQTGSEYDDADINTLYPGHDQQLYGNDDSDFFDIYGNIETENSEIYANNNQQAYHAAEARAMAQTNKKNINENSSSVTYARENFHDASLPRTTGSNQYRRNRFGNYDDDDDVTPYFANSNDYGANTGRHISGTYTDELTKSNTIKSDSQGSFGVRGVGLQEGQSHLEDFDDEANSFEGEKDSFSINQNPVDKGIDGVGKKNLGAYATGEGSDGSADGAGNNFDKGENGGLGRFTWGADGVTSVASGYKGGADGNEGEVGDYTGGIGGNADGIGRYEGGAGDFTDGIGGNAGGADGNAGIVGGYTGGIGGYKGGADGYDGGIGGYKGKAGGFFKFFV